MHARSSLVMCASNTSCCHGYLHKMTPSLNLASSPSTKGWFYPVRFSRQAQQQLVLDTGTLKLLEIPHSCMGTVR